MTYLENLQLKSVHTIYINIHNFYNKGTIKANLYELDWLSVRVDADFQ